MAKVNDNRIRGVRASIPSNVVIGRVDKGTGKAQLLDSTALRRILGPGFIASIAAGTSPTLTQNHIFVGNASNLPSDVAMSGDATIVSSGALTLADTAVTPGSYGDGTHISTFTVDSKGRLTAAAQVAISAGATPTVATLSIGVSGTGTKSAASIGQIMTPGVNVSVLGVGVQMTTVTSGVYKFGIAPYNTSTNQITAAPTYTSTYTESAGAANTSFFINFSSSVSMTGKQAYIVFFVRTDSTTTVSQTVNLETAANKGPAFYLPTSGAFQLASLGPTTSDTWTNSGGAVWGFQMVYTL